LSSRFAIYTAMAEQAGCIWLRRFSIQIVARGNTGGFLRENMPPSLSLASRRDAPLGRTTKKPPLLHP
jgi:hypothetical protein